MSRANLVKRAATAAAANESTWRFPWTGTALAGLSLGALLMTGCAHKADQQGPAVVQKTPSPGAAAAGQPTYKVGNPYQIGGIWYYPRADYDYDQTGIASWYGPGFHQERTANGEIFDQNELTAAHQTLPMPSLVRVTNLDNGRSIVVRINDRGPFAAGRIIDLSRRAAQLLGMEQQGTAKVRVQILADESRAIAAAAMQAGGAQVALNAPPSSAAPVPTTMADGSPVPKAAPRPSVTVQGQALPPAQGAAPGPSPAPSRPVQAPTTVPGTTEPDGRFLPAPVVQQVAVGPGPKKIYVQAGSFTLFDNANKLRARLAGIGPSFLAPTMVNGTQFFRVRVGPLDTPEQADQVLDQVVAAGNNGARVIVE
ncbi:septal ring lytic transglycosylase RlpA family protein [Nitrospirillum sp. BR 11828]|uniref:septal ring lytic transglycosylase RlpA family protein n=1 Tax=Nitrospirillum sp. BR 11828 TaxID=3104325 RepID=UPI002ACA7C0C|nr:septal ring lytic transglycosylase RlpA family protein [Nitrospirillum sp. BR 11828]MDZ5648444.1 septal ring lytic transglycosylase RlpA family protein [Nitrospirillum sp. BR 11828]